MDDNNLHIELGDGADEIIGLSALDRRRHIYISGATGVGKSTLLAHMCVSDMRQGEGFTLLDPHGDLCRSLLDYVPKSRTKDVIFLNPFDDERIFGLNIFDLQSTREPSIAAADVVATFANMWGLSNEHTPRLLHYLRNAVLALVEVPGTSLVSLLLMLTDKQYRDKIIDRVENPVVKRFWTQEFPGNPNRYNAEAMAPVLSRVQSLLAYDRLRRIVGQKKTTIDFRELLDQKKILLCDLSKGALGEEPASLLGALIVTQMQIVAMSRVDQKPDERTDHWLYVDEAQSFMTKSFDTLFSEARKMSLGLCISHQYKNQIDDKTLSSFMANAGSKIFFRSSAEDAEYFSHELAPMKLDEIVELPAFNAWITRPKQKSRRRLITRDLPPPDRKRAHKVIDQSRRQYCRSRKHVEADLKALL